MILVVAEQGGGIGFVSPFIVFLSLLILSCIEMAQELKLGLSFSCRQARRHKHICPSEPGGDTLSLDKL